MKNRHSEPAYRQAGVVRNLHIDQLGREIRLEKTPSRIVSIVPSQTELLSDLRLNEEVVGITKYCVHPSGWLQSKPLVGGTKKLNFDKIRFLRPDLIIGNKEENQKEQVEELMKHYPVWVSDIKTLGDNYNMIASIGEIVNRKEEAQKIIENIKNNFSQLKTLNSKRKTTYLIWRKPYIAAGHSTFISHLLEKCGFANVFTGPGSRYPEISVAQLAAAQPELVLLSSEPYPFKERHLQEFQQICPSSKIVLVDGEMFSWYGSRLVQAPSYFTRLLSNL